MTTIPYQTEAAGGELPVLPVPHGCSTCGVVLDAERLRASLYVCDCGRHLPMHADAWIALLADSGSWHERWGHLQPRDVLGWLRPKPYPAALREARARALNEAVRTGDCRLGGHRVWLAVFDFRFIGGTLGVVAGERLARGIEQAARQRLPYLLVTASGGARMQEGVLALLQMAKANAALHKLHEAAVPYISILTDPTFGGTAASLALLADVNIAEPDAAIGFTGARVIRQATYADLPPGFQRAEYQLRHGQVDMIVPRTELRNRLLQLLEAYR